MYHEVSLSRSLDELLIHAQYHLKSIGGMGTTTREQQLVIIPNLSDSLAR